jgi:hypothetical protein
MIVLRSRGVDTSTIYYRDQVPFLVSLNLNLSYQTCRWIGFRVLRVYAIDIRQKDCPRDPFRTSQPLQQCVAAQYRSLGSFVVVLSVSFHQTGIAVQDRHKSGSESQLHRPSKSPRH